MRSILAFTLLAFGSTAGVSAGLADRLDEELAALAPRIIEWRRDFHQHAELSNREFRTSKRVADHLRKLGLAVETGIAKTGVVALLRGGRPGPTIMLRADMDGLPVTEEVDLPFRSRMTSTYRGESVGVMHACGHDVHTAALMGIASALTTLRADISGDILFVFQPAEEGPPPGEAGGAPLMLQEGLFERYRPEVALGLHVHTSLRVGQIGYRGGPFMAASDAFQIKVRGMQTHGAMPWAGVDPIVTAAQIVGALQTIVSRQVDISTNPAVVTVGAIKGGIRNNIVPDEVEMVGTIRSFDPQQRDDILMRMRRTVTSIAAANGAAASFELTGVGNPVVFNHPELTTKLLPALQRVAGSSNVRGVPLVTGAEDFAFFAQKVPSFFFFVGITPADRNPVTVPANHSPRFFVDEAGIPIGTRALAHAALAYLAR